MRDGTHELRPVAGLAQDDGVPAEYEEQRTIFHDVPLLDVQYTFFKLLR